MKESTCDVCGEPTTGELCEEHRDTPVLYRLGPNSTIDDVEEGKVYSGLVNGIVEYGAFVDLNQNVSGLIHESNLSSQLEVDDEVKVRISEKKENGDLEMVPVYMHEYNEASLESETELTSISDLGDYLNSNVEIQGLVHGIRQTSGPTLFKIGDGTGTVECAAFEEAGVRAYPEINEEDAVEVSGLAELHKDDLQIEVREMKRLVGDEEEEAMQRINDGINERSEPPEKPLLADTQVLRELKPKIREIAKELRKAVINGRPVIIRHHADADGITSGVALEQALQSLIARENDDSEAPYHLLKRRPSRAPFYEMRDVTRDLSMALEDTRRFGHSDPVLLMVDNGSTKEDTPAYEIANAYDIPIYIIDHHSPDDSAVSPFVETHLNPYLEDGDYSITSGMLCTEIARLIDPSVDEGIQHLPGVSGMGDRSESEEMDQYLELAQKSGFSEDRLEEIATALDYISFQLKFRDGKHLVEDVLGIGETEAHEELVNKLSERANTEFQKQMNSVLPHVSDEALDNGVILYSINLEQHAHKFTFPNPGKATGRLHDIKTNETDKPVVTIGYGPDFCVIRGHDVEIDIPEIVDDLKEELDDAGISGGGHKDVGSVKFVQGKRDEVLLSLVDFIESYPLTKDIQT